MTIYNNYGVEGKPDDHPVTPDHPTESNATLPYISNYMMALLNSIQQTTDNIYNQQAADAKTLAMLQEYMQDIQKNQSDAINQYIKDNSGKDADGNSKYTADVAATVSQMQAQMSAEMGKANSAVSAQQSTLSNDVKNAGLVTDIASSLNVVTGELTRLLSS